MGGNVYTRGRGKLDFLKFLLCFLLIFGQKVQTRTRRRSHSSVQRARLQKILQPVCPQKMALAWRKPPPLNPPTATHVTAAHLPAAIALGWWWGGIGWGGGEV